MGLQSSSCVQLDLLFCGLAARKMLKYWSLVKLQKGDVTENVINDLVYSIDAAK